MSATGTKLSGLTLATSLAGGEVIGMLQSGQNKGVTPTLLRAFARDGLAIGDVSGLSGALGAKADASALSGYATTSALATGLSGKQPTGDYATNTALTSGLATKANASALASYATLAALNAYYTSAEVDDLLDDVSGGGYAKLAASGAHGGYLDLYDDTADVGLTRLSIREGAADVNTGNYLLRFLANNNAVRGGVKASINEIQIVADHISDLNTGYFDLRTTGFSFVSGLMMQWATGAPYNSPDVAFGRAIAGHLAATDGGTGGVPVGHCLVGRSSTTAGREMARISAEWADDTDATRTTVYHVSLVENAADVAERFRVDHGAGAGSTGLWVYNAGTGAMSRVLVSASEQAPAGKHALYLN